MIPPTTLGVYGSGLIKSMTALDDAFSGFTYSAWLTTEAMRSLKPLLIDIEEKRVPDWKKPQYLRTRAKAGKPSKLIAAMMQRT